MTTTRAAAVRPRASRPQLKRDPLDSATRLEPGTGASGLPGPTLRVHAILGVRMPQPSTKELIREVVERLPPDATVEDAMERLLLLAKIERGLAQADAGE